MTKLSYQDFTTKILVIIKGDSQEDIEQDFNGFYNHNGTDGCQAKSQEPHLVWTTGDWRHGGYFYSTKERLLKAMASRSLFKLLNDGHTRKEKGGMMPQAQDMARTWYDSMMKVTDFIKQHTDFSDPSNHGSSLRLGRRDAEKPDADWGNRETA